MGSHPTVSRGLPLNRKTGAILKLGRWLSSTASILAEDPDLLQQHRNAEALHRQFDTRQLAQCAPAAHCLGQSGARQHVQQILFLGPAASPWAQG